jgi:hypothetical protein
MNGNLLIKKTSKKEIAYTFEEFGQYDTIIVPTFGYRIIITDFEKSLVELDKNELGIATFWDSLETLCKRVDTQLENTNGYRIRWNNNNVLLFLQNPFSNKRVTAEVSTLLHLITETEFIFKPIVKYTYNPNI